MASSTRRFLISRPGAESFSWTIRWRAAEKSGSTAGCELPTARRIACRRHSGRIAPHIGGKIRLFSRYARGLPFSCILGNSAGPGRLFSELRVISSVDLNGELFDLGSPVAFARHG